MAKATATRKARIAKERDEPIKNAPSASGSVPLTHNQPANMGNVVHVRFNKLADAAIQAEADEIIHKGTAYMGLMEKHIRAFQSDRTYTDNARAIFDAARERARQHWIANPGFSKNADRAPPPVRDERLAEWRTCVRMGEWACINVVLDYFRLAKMTKEDVLAVARTLQREQPDRTAKDAPAMDVFIAAIREAKAKKNGEKKARAGEVKPVKIEDAVATGRAFTDGLRLWFGKAEFAGKRADAAAILAKIDSDVATLVAMGQPTAS